jgi:drug/metabolite transporter (DMT)-like permease
MTEPHKDHPLLGMSAAVAAFFCFSVMNVFAKTLAETHHVIEIAFYRNLIALLPFLFAIYVMGKKEILVIRSNPRGIVIRSIIGTVSLAATFGTFALLPLADGQAFLFTASLLIPALGFFFLGEKVGPYRWGATIVGFMGVCVMLRPSGDVNMMGVTVALSAACLHATLQTILRYLGKTERPETVTFYFVFIGTFVAMIPMPLVFTMPTWHDLPFIIGLGLSGVVGQILISMAYKYAQASVVTIFNYSAIIWATSFGWMFWDEWPERTIFIGGAIVIASNVFIVLREHKLAKAQLAEVQKADGL